jgi:hypothetical protein
MLIEDLLLKRKKLISELLTLEYGCKKYRDCEGDIIKLNLNILDTLSKEYHCEICGCEIYLRSLLFITDDTIRYCKSCLPLIFTVDLFLNNLIYESNEN